MDKNLVEQIQSYYEKNNQKIFKKFKEESSNNDSEQNYINYCQKCYNLLNEIDENLIFKECSNIQNDIKDRINKINNTKNDLISAVNETKFPISKKNEENEISNYKLNNDDLKKKLENLKNQIDNLDLNSSLESMKKVKTEIEKDSDLSIQNYYNNLYERIKFYNLVNREKKSKLTSLEEKKTTLNNNNFKIEKLKKEYTKNTERMKSELECNENLQKDISNLINKIEEVKKMKDHHFENNKIIEEENIKFNHNKEELIMKLKDFETQIKRNQNELNKKYYYFSSAVFLYKMTLINNKNKSEYKILAINLAQKLKQTIERRQQLIQFFNNIHQSTIDKMKRIQAFKNFENRIQKVYEKYNQISKTLN